MSYAHGNGEAWQPTSDDLPKQQTISSQLQGVDDTELGCFSKIKQNLKKYACLQTGLETCGTAVNGVMSGLFHERCIRFAGYPLKTAVGVPFGAGFYGPAFTRIALDPSYLDPEEKWDPCLIGCAAFCCPFCSLYGAMKGMHMCAAHSLTSKEVFAESYLNIKSTDNPIHDCFYNQPLSKEQAQEEEQRYNDAQAWWFDRVLCGWESLGGSLFCFGKKLR